MKEISLPDLLEARVHLGHRTRKWNPRMKKYVYTQSEGIYIIDLVLTRKCLQEARDFISDLGERGGTVLFVGTKRQAREPVEKWARQVGAPYVTERWPGGLLTNFSEVQKGLEKLRDLKALIGTDEWEELSTRDQYQVRREIERAERVFGGIIDLQELPGALFVVDPKREKLAVKEAGEVGVPVVSLIDTNGDPTGIDYPIPGNDDSSRSIDLILQLALDSLVDGEVPGMDKEEDEVSAEEVVEGEGPETIEGSDLPSRAKTALAREGYDTLEEIRRLTVEELKEIKGIGAKTAREVAKKLSGGEG